MSKKRTRSAGYASGTAAASRPAPAAPPAAGPRSNRLPYGVAAGIALLVFLWAYSPVIRTGFLFDDTNQRFALPTEAGQPLSKWIGPVRPVLMFSYWMNVQISRESTLSYHVFNLSIHALAAVLVFLAVCKLLEWAAAGAALRTPLAAFGAALFLLHPLQTESVAYISGRSEALSGMLALASLTAFLYRKTEAISWPVTLAVLALFGAAVLSKEQAVVVPFVLLLTDFWWNPGFSLKGIFRNWKLYALCAAGGLAAVALFWKLILGVGTGGSAGFGMKDLGPYQYLCTQFRALWVYIANFVLPLNLNLDWEFSISRGIFDRGSILGLLALAALAAAAWRYRARFQLASYGYFLFLIFLLPTSSILPIKDPIADRRMYLPMIGLILIALDFLLRWRIDRKALAALCAAVLLAMVGLTYARVQLWSDPVALWEDTARKSPGKSRVHFQLAQAYFDAQQFDRASIEFEKAARIEKPDYALLLDWGLALDSLHQPAQALDKLRQAAALEPKAHVYTQIGKVYAGQQQWKEAMEAFNTAQTLDPNFTPTYAYKGLVRLATGDIAGGVQECRHALEIDANFQPARDCLATAQRLISQ